MRFDRAPRPKTAVIMRHPAEHIGENHGRKDRRQERGQMPGHARRNEPRLVAAPAGPPGSPPQLFPVRSNGRGVRLRQGVQEPRPQGRDQGPARPDDGFAALVAGRLRPLWRPVHPPGVARCGHLPHHRRPWRRRHRPAALRAAQLVAGQRQPRQGAPPPLADQAEVRQENLLGRPAGPRRQRRSRVDGLQDLRFRRRPRRCVGARRTVLGSRRHVARRRTLQRRTPALPNRSARCRWA